MVESLSINENEHKKRIKKNFLFLLLSGIDDYGNNLRLLSKKLYNDETKLQRLNYWLKKLKSVSFIEKNQSHPFAIYSLTPMGQRIKKILRQSEKQPSTPLWRCHALIVGFDIRNLGSFQFTETRHRRMKYMNNWKFAKEEVVDAMGKWIINIHSTGLLKIYCPEHYTTEPDTAFARMQNEAYRIAKFYKRNYGMDLSEIKVIRSGHKELVNSEKLASLFGKRTRIADVWVDASTGSSWLEEKQESYAIEDLLKTPQKMDRMEKIMSNSLVPTLSELSRQIKLHLSVMQKIGTGIDEMKETMKAIREDLRK